MELAVYFESLSVLTVEQVPEYSFGDIVGREPLSFVITCYVMSVSFGIIYLPKKCIKRLVTYLVQCNSYEKFQNTCKCRANTKPWIYLKWGQATRGIRATCGMVTSATRHSL
jgi:hypothetical protein